MWATLSNRPGNLAALVCHKVRIDPDIFQHCAPNRGDMLICDGKINRPGIKHLQDIFRAEFLFSPGNIDGGQPFAGKVLVQALKMRNVT